MAGILFDVLPTFLVGAAGKTCSAGFSLCNGHVRPPVRLSVPSMAAATFDPHLPLAPERSSERAGSVNV